MPQILWSTTSDRGRFDHKGWHKATGAPISCCDGDEWTEWVHPQDREAALLAWTHAFQLNEPFQIEYRLRRCCGDYRWVLVGGQPERSDQGEVIGWYGACTDIEEIVQARALMQRSHDEQEALVGQPTAERNSLGTLVQRTDASQLVKGVTRPAKDERPLGQAQEALLQAQKLEAIGQLTAGVAHDFNNLLMPILGALDMLARRGLGGEREQRVINGALEAAERARTLIQRLMTFARPQLPRAAPIDLNGLVGDAANLIATAVGPAVAISIELGDPGPWAKADRHQLEMAILNLCVNARDAMDGTGQVTISVTAELVGPGHRTSLAPGPYVRIGVCDTGKGMDEATRARAIEPFYSTKAPGQGTGLGLSTAHGLASQLGGMLTIDSQVGEGSQVSIWLPQCAESLVSAARPRHSSLAELLTGVVLLVDDDAHIRDITTEMLTELGFQVHEAASPEAALAAVDAGLEPDILVTDQLMVGMTGVELAYAVRERRPAARALIISGFADVESLDKDFPRLAKPFVQNDLAAVLAEMRRSSPLQRRNTPAGGARHPKRARLASAVKKSEPKSYGG